MPFTPEQKTSLESIFNKPLVQQSFGTTDPSELETIIPEAISHLESLYDNFVQIEVTLLETALVWHIIFSLKNKVQKKEFPLPISSRLTEIIKDLEGLYLLMRV